MYEQTYAIFNMYIIFLYKRTYTSQYIYTGEAMGIISDCVTSPQFMRLSPLSAPPGILSPTRSTCGMPAGGTVGTGGGLVARVYDGGGDNG